MKTNKNAVVQVNENGPAALQGCFIQVRGCGVKGDIGDPNTVVGFMVLPSKDKPQKIKINIEQVDFIGYSELEIG